MKVLLHWSGRAAGPGFDRSNPEGDRTAPQQSQWWGWILALDLADAEACQKGGESSTALIGC